MEFLARRFPDNFSGPGALLCVRTMEGRAVGACGVIARKRIESCRLNVLDILIFCRSPLALP